MLRSFKKIQKCGTMPARFLAWAVVVGGIAALLTACGGGGGGGSRSGPTMTITPIVNTDIPVPNGNVTLQALGDGSYQSHEFDASRISALDTGSQTRTYTASSSNTGVATASVSGSMVMVTPKSKGMAGIMINAESPGSGGSSQRRSFTYMARVPNRTPTASGTISAMTLAAVGNTDTRDVSSRFTDPDGDTLNYTARSSAHRVATIGVSGSVVTVTAVAAGRATITVTATDNDPTNPLTAMQTFSVTVSAPATGFAPANQAAFNAALVGKQIMSGDYFFSFSPPNSLSLLEVSTSTTYSGSYTYTNTGSNMGRIVANYDDGRCTYNITYVSATTGTATTICNDEAATSGTWRIVDTMATGGDGPGLARAGECQVGGTYRPGESCDVYGIGSSTKRPFQVLSSGTGHFGFSISGNSIDFRNSTINGVLYYLVASNQGGGVWRIDEYRSS